MTTASVTRNLQPVVSAAVSGTAHTMLDLFLASLRRIRTLPIDALKGRTMSIAPLDGLLLGILGTTTVVALAFLVTKIYNRLKGIKSYEQLENDISSLRTQLNSKDTEIATLQTPSSNANELEQMKKNFKALQNDLLTKNTQIQDLAKTLETEKTHLSTQKTALKELQNKFNIQKAALDNMTTSRDALKQQINTYLTTPPKAPGSQIPPVNNIPSAGVAAKALFYNTQGSGSWSQPSSPVLTTLPMPRAPLALSLDPLQKSQGLAKLEENIKQQAAELSSKQDTINKLTEQLQQKQQQITKSAETIASLTNKVEQLTNNIQIKEKLLAKAQEIGQCSAAYAEAQKTLIQKQTEELESLKQKMEPTQNQLQCTLQELENAENMRTTLQQKLEENQIALTNEKTKNTEITHLIEIEQRKAIELQAASNKTSEFEKQKMQEIETMKNDINKLNMTIVNLTTSEKNLRSSSALLFDELNQIKTQKQWLSPEERLDLMLELEVASSAMLVHTELDYPITKIIASQTIIQQRSYVMSHYKVVQEQYAIIINRVNLINVLQNNARQRPDRQTYLVNLKIKLDGLTKKFQKQGLLQDVNNLLARMKTEKPKPKFGNTPFTQVQTDLEQIQTTLTKQYNYFNALNIKSLTT